MLAKGMKTFTKRKYKGFRRDSETILMATEGLQHGFAKASEAHKGFPRICQKLFHGAMAAGWPPERRQRKRKIRKK